MKKRVWAAVLAFALAATLCPVALAAGKLSTPTDLQWGVLRYNASYSEPCPDAMSWNFGENITGIIQLTVYKDDLKLTDVQYEYSSSVSNRYGNETLTQLCADQGFSLNSGTYYFTVQNITDWDSTSSNNSNLATSPKWTYTPPSVKLAAPTDPVWDFPHYTWKSNQNSVQVMIRLYYSQTRNGAYDLLFARPSYRPGRDEVDEWALKEFGAGYYKFQVMSLSTDISQWQSSDWSPFSEPYYYDGSKVIICQHSNGVSGKNGKDATCTEDGYSGDFYCRDCGEMMEKGWVMPAEGHDLDSRGICRNCDKQIARYGFLGQNYDLSWTYNIEEGTISFDGDIPSLETVLVACYNDSGRFTGVKLIDRQTMEAQVGTNFATMKLFWLDNRKAPKCQAVEVPPA